MADILCDTSFLINLATKKIKNFENLDTEIGQIRFVVPTVVLDELKKLCNDESKKQSSFATIEYIKNLKTIEISGKYADDAIINYVKDNHGIVATMDKELKIKIKNYGGSILTFASERIILES